MKKPSKWFMLQASHEVRMWLKTIGVAGLATAIYLDQHPEKKWALEEKCKELKEKFSKKN